MCLFSFIALEDWYVTDDIVADINNVGLITLALYAKGKPIYNEIELSAWQTAQVSILSISNWAGRILIGITFCAMTFPS